MELSIPMKTKGPASVSSLASSLGVQSDPAEAADAMREMSQTVSQGYGSGASSFDASGGASGYGGGSFDTSAAPGFGGANGFGSGASGFGGASASGFGGQGQQAPGFGGDTQQTGGLGGQIGKVAEGLGLGSLLGSLGIGKQTTQSSAGFGGQGQQTSGFGSQPSAEFSGQSSAGFGGQGQQTSGFGSQPTSQPASGFSSQPAGFGSQTTPQSTGFSNQPTPQPARSGGVQLKKGQKASLAKMVQGELDEIDICLGWRIKNPACDLDSSLFMLDQTGRVPGDDWFVFYGQPQSPDRSIYHHGDVSQGSTGPVVSDAEIISAKLSMVNPQIQKLVIIATIDSALELGLNFSMVDSAYIRIVNKANNVEVARFDLSEYYSNVTSMIVAEIYRHNGEWKISPVGDGVAKDLAGLCGMYGVNVAD